MGNTGIEGYQKRFYKVLEYIEQHLDDRPDIDQLSKVAHCSKFHFHRQFTHFFGISPARYMVFMKLKRSAFQLAFRKQLKITDIALQAGFESPESFNRAFKRITGLSPSKFRQTPEWSCWQHSKEIDLPGNITLSEVETNLVEIVDFAQTRLAALEHRGDPGQVYTSIEKFIAWRKLNGPSPRHSRTFNILYDDPDTTAAHLYRFDIAASLKGELCKNDSSIVQKTIPAGRCAMLRVKGGSEHLKQNIAWLFSEWLVQSGEGLRDFPLFVERITFFPDVAEHEMLTDVYLPLD